MSTIGPEWREGATVYSNDPTIGYGHDGSRWRIARGGGPHCAYRSHTYPFGVGCSLAPDHEGLHMPTADELLADGIRMSPLPPEENPDA